MTATQLMETTGHKAACRSWGPAFEVDGDGVAARAHFPELLQIRREEILTAHIPGTVSVHQNMRSGAITMMSRELSGSGPTGVLEAFALIATHAMLARSRFAQIKAPAFWLRVKGDRGAAVLRPAFPLSQAAEMIGIEVRSLKTLLAPLVDDGAVEVVQSPDGVQAVVMRDGYIDDGRVRRFLRV